MNTKAGSDCPVGPALHRSVNSEFQTCVKRHSQVSQMEGRKTSDALLGGGGGGGGGGGSACDVDVVFVPLICTAFTALCRAFQKDEKNPVRHRVRSIKPDSMA